MYSLISQFCIWKKDMSATFNCVDMFSINSSFAKNFKYGATNCSNLKCFGLFTYFHDQLVDRFRDAPCYSVSFDECMDKISQNEQMDFIVRYWDSDTGQDRVRVSWPCHCGRSPDAFQRWYNYSWTLCDNSMDGPSECELEVLRLHCSGTRTQNTCRNSPNL